MIQKRLKANIQSNAIIDVNTALKQQVDTNTINIQSNTQKINDLEPKVQANQQGVATNAQDILDLTNRIDNLPAVDLQNYYRKDEIDQQQAAQDAVIATKANITDVVDLTTEQTITGLKKFNNHIHIDNNALKLEGIQSGGMIASSTGDIVLIPAGGKNIKCASRRVRDVGAPVDNTDATNKQYVDTAIANIPTVDLTGYVKKTDTANTIITAPIINLTSKRGDIELRVPQGSSVNLKNQHISGLANPTHNQHAANKQYVDTAIANIDLTNYYTKAEIDASQTTQDNRVDTIQDQVNQNTTDIGTKANINDVYTKTQSDGRFGRKDQTNEWRYKQVFKNNTEAQIQIQPWDGNYGVYISLNNQRGQRFGYLGKPSGTSPDFEWKNEQANANTKLTTTGNGKVLYNNQEIATVNQIPGPTDLTNYYTKGEVYSKQETYSKAESDTFNQQQDTKINQLIEENKKQVNIVFEIIDANTYNKGDQGYKGTQWYLCLVNGSLGNQTGDATKWKPINYQTQVDLSNYYTKPETTALLNNKANDNQVVKLEGGQTINGAKIFTNSVGLGTNFELTPETGVMRIAPKATGKWLYFGNPNTAYFDGIDLNNRVNLNGVKTPTQDTQAANKQYVDNAIAAIPAPDLSNYYTKPEADGKYATKQEIANSAKTNVANTFTTNQKVNARLEVRQNEETLKLGNGTTNSAAYIGIYNGNNRIGYIGKASANSNTMEVSAQNNDMIVSGNNITLRANGSIVANDKKITRVATPTAGKDAANKEYVDTAIRNIPSTSLSNYYTKPQVDSKVNEVKLKQLEIKRTISPNVSMDLITGLGPNKKIANIEAYRQASGGDQWYSIRPHDTYRIFRFPDKITINTSVEGGFSNNWWIIITYFEY